MRLPSLLFAAATIMLAYLLGRRLMSRQAALVATFLLAINVLHQQYSQAATMYAMLAFLLTLCVYGMLSDNEWLAASGFIGAIYTHYFGFYLALPLLLYYYHRSHRDWKKLAGKIGLYVAAYLPWLVIALQGLQFHANRTSGLRWWDFHWLNIIRQLSLILLVGAIYFFLAQRRKPALQPALLLCGLFLASAFFLIPFQRYLVPFLPALIVLGVAGLAELGKRIAQRWSGENRISRVAIWAALGVALLAPNPEAYGIYPAMGRHLDWRDAIHTQEWRRIVATIPAGRVATPNARSLLFYGNLRGVRQYKVDQFNENDREFTTLIARAENEWIVLPKHPLYAALIRLADKCEQYRLFAEFDYTIIYRKNFLN
jgi:4-amino-4-deoxy-L-arabinose transferase-like glycosyltransferase